MLSPPDRDRTRKLPNRQLWRYAKCLRRAREAQDLARGTSDECPEPSYRDTTALVLDVQLTLGRLSDDDRQVCEDLSHGYSVREIADRLGCDWHTVNRRIARIREQFIQWGLDGWLESA